MEDVLNVIDLERPEGIIVQFGGQTPLKIATDLQRALDENPIPASSGARRGAAAAGEVLFLRWRPHWFLYWLARAARARLAWMVALAWRSLPPPPPPRALARPPPARRQGQRAHLGHAARRDRRGGGPRPLDGAAQPPQHQAAGAGAGAALGAVRGLACPPSGPSPPPAQSAPAPRPRAPLTHTPHTPTPHAHPSNTKHTAPPPPPRPAAARAPTWRRLTRRASWGTP